MSAHTFQKYLTLPLTLALALLASVGPVHAQEPEEVLPPVTDVQPLEIAEETGIPDVDEPFSFYAGANFVSRYISRGVLFSSRASFQPWAELYIDLPDPESDQIDNWSLFFGTWNSLQEGGPGLGQRTDEPLDNWYETDLYTGVTVTFLTRFNTSLAYYYYHSPSDSFDGYGDLEWKLNYDDSQWWGESGFSINPGLRISREIDHPNERDALYVQPSLTPTWTTKAFGHDMIVAVPLVAGFSDGYYTDPGGNDETFGFFMAGINASMGLDILPEDAGSLTLSGGVDFWMPSDNIVSGLDDDVELVGKIGLSWAY